MIRLALAVVCIVAAAVLEIVALVLIEPTLEKVR